MIKLLSVLFPFILVQASDEPNLVKEKTFFNLYQKYNLNPTDANYWEKVVGLQKSRSYSIQKGDTLWSLSETLFGDSEVWPKLWAVNSNSLENPHVIIPGNEIKFYFGNSEAPPAIGVGPPTPISQTSTSTSDSSGRLVLVVPADEDVAFNKTPEKPASIQFSEGSKNLIPIEVITNDGSKVIKYLDLDQVKLPQGKPERKLLAELPASLPSGNYVANTHDSKVDFSEVNKKTTPFKSLRRVNFFVSTNGLSEEGTVISGEGSLSQFQSGFIGEKVLVQGSDLQGQYLVVRKLGSINGAFAPSSSTLFEILGQIKVFNLANESAKLYRGQITSLASRFVKGAILVKMEWPEVNLTESQSISSVAATVFGGSQAPDLKYAAKQQLVFLNKGSADGITLGQNLNVYRNPKVRNAESVEKSNLPTVGLVQVVQVGENVSTAFVIDSSDPIRPGDRTSVIQE